MRLKHSWLAERIRIMRAGTYFQTLGALNGGWFLYSVSAKAGNILRKSIVFDALLAWQFINSGTMTHLRNAVDICLVRILALPKHRGSHHLVLVRTCQERGGSVEDGRTIIERRS